MALLILVAILNLAAAIGVVAYRIAKRRTDFVAFSCLACFSATVSAGLVLTLAVKASGIA